jgi:hypothetical protein
MNASETVERNTKVLHENHQLLMTINSKENEIKSLQSELSIYQSDKYNLMNKVKEFHNNQLISERKATELLSLNNKLQGTYDDLKQQYEITLMELEKVKRQNLEQLQSITSLSSSLSIHEKSLQENELLTQKLSQLQLSLQQKEQSYLKELELIKYSKEIISQDAETSKTTLIIKEKTIKELQQQFADLKRQYEEVLLIKENLYNELKCLESLKTEEKLEELKYEMNSTLEEFHEIEKEKSIKQQLLLTLTSNYEKEKEKNILLTMQLSLLEEKLKIYQQELSVFKGLDIYHTTKRQELENYRTLTASQQQQQQQQQRREGDDVVEEDDDDEGRSPEKSSYENSHLASRYPATSTYRPVSTTTASPSRRDHHTRTEKLLNPSVYRRSQSPKKVSQQSKGRGGDTDSSTDERGLSMEDISTDNHQMVTSSLEVKQPDHLLNKQRKRKMLDENEIDEKESSSTVSSVSATGERGDNNRQTRRSEATGLLKQSLKNERKEERYDDDDEVEEDDIGDEEDDYDDTTPQSSKQQHKHQHQHRYQASDRPTLSKLVNNYSKQLSSYSLSRDRNDGPSTSERDISPEIIREKKKQASIPANSRYSSYRDERENDDDTSSAPPEEQLLSTKQRLKRKEKREKLMMEKIMLEDQQKQRQKEREMTKKENERRKTPLSPHQPFDFNDDDADGASPYKRLDRPKRTTVSLDLPSSRDRDEKKGKTISSVTASAGGYSSSSTNDTNSRKGGDLPSFTRSIASNQSYLSSSQRLSTTANQYQQPSQQKSNSPSNQSRYDRMIGGDSGRPSSSLSTSAAPTTRSYVDTTGYQRDPNYISHIRSMANIPYSSSNSRYNPSGPQLASSTHLMTNKIDLDRAKRLLNL